MTQDEIYKLSDERLRVAVAESLGWTRHPSEPYWRRPDGFGDDLPNYPRDISACIRALACWPFWQITRVSGVENGYGCVVRFEIAESWFADGPAPCTAICRCILLATRKETKHA